MRDLINLIERAIRVENGGGEPLTVIENPSLQQLWGAFDGARGGLLRGFLTHDDQIYVWDAYSAAHYEIMDQLGIDPQRQSPFLTAVEISDMNDEHDWSKGARYYQAGPFVVMFIPEDKRHFLASARFSKLFPGLEAKGTRAARPRGYD